MGIILSEEIWLSLSSLVYLTNYGKIYKKVLGFNFTCIYHVHTYYCFLTTINTTLK